MAEMPSAPSERLKEARNRPLSRKALRWVFLLIVVLLVMAAAVMLARVAGYKSLQVSAPAAGDIPVDEARATQHLATALSIPTVSRGPSDFDRDALLRLHAALANLFPLTHRSLAREVVADYSLLYRWGGTDPSLRPIVLLAHMDVVPVEPGSENSWEVPPFEGRVSDGFIWGRGALDDKSSLIGILEAVESLIGRGFRPRRTVYLAFGHDEEVGGSGARSIAKLLASRNAEAALILDEGSFITKDVLTGVSAPFAAVAVSEKGRVVVELTVDTPGGHAGWPPPQTAIGILATAVARLEAHQMARRLDGPTRAMLDTVGREMSFARRLVFANLWSFGGLVMRQLMREPSSDALLHTTTSATIFEAGIMPNVLPAHARAVVSFRIIPGDSIAGVLDHVRRVVADSRVAIRPLQDAFLGEPTSASDMTGPVFTMLARTIRQIVSGAVVAPSLAPAPTDARHYVALSRGVYRLIPQVLTPEDLLRLHGANERLTVAQLAQTVRFYIQILVNAAGPEGQAF